MRREIKLIGMLVVMAILIQPAMAQVIHVVDRYDGTSVSVARVNICDGGGNIIEWGYTDSYGDYDAPLADGENYLIKASYANKAGAVRIKVDMFTPNTIEVAIG